MASKGSSGKSSSSSSKSSGKVTVSVGGKNISLTVSQLSSLSPATKAALNASIKSGKSTVSYGGTTLGAGGFSSGGESSGDVPAKKTLSTSQKRVLQKSYQDMIDRGTKSEDALSKVRAAGSVGGYELGDIDFSKPIISAGDTPTKKVDTTIVGTDTKTADLGKKKIDTPDIPGKDTEIGKDFGLDLGIVGTNGIKTNTQKDIITPETPAKPTIAMAKGEIGRDINPGIGGQKYVAANGKVYDMSVDPATGQTSFVSKATGETRKFSSAQDAIAEINAQNIGTNPTGFMKDGKLDSEVPAIAQMTDLATTLQDLGQKNADDYKSNVEPFINQMAQYNSEVANNLASVIQSRISGMNSGFSTMSTQIADLETKANNLFDQQKMASMRAREQGLAAQGILTSEQSAASGERAVQDYTNEVELKRSELMKAAAEMKVNAEKERIAMNDQILQQQGIDEVTKQQMTQAVNQMYQNMYANYGTMVESANTSFANAMNTANQAKLGVDMLSAQPMIEERVKATLSGIQKDKANSDAMYRYDYILQKLGEIDPNLRKYAGSIMAKDVAAGNFITQPIDMYISSLVGKIMPSYRADAKAGAV